MATYALRHHPLCIGQLSPRALSYGADVHHTKLEPQGSSPTPGSISDLQILTDTKWYMGSGILWLIAGPASCRKDNDGRFV